MCAGAAMYRRSSIRTVSMVKSRFQVAMLGSFDKSTCRHVSYSDLLRAIHQGRTNFAIALVDVGQVDLAEKGHLWWDIGVVGSAVDFE